MPAKNKMMFTSGQFAKLHNINKRTLHYYDEIGLFSPSYIGENGYRYYTYAQSPLLEMLLTLRELHMSIDEISSFINNRTPISLRNIIVQKTKEIDDNIKRLRSIKKLLLNQEELLDLADQIDLSMIEIVDCKEEYLILSDSLTGLEDDDYFPVLIDHTQILRDHRLFNKNYGTMISSEHILAENYDDYDCFFIKVDNKPKNVKVFTKPQGRYIRGFCIGNWDRLPSAYARMVAFAKENEIILTGYAYEEGINEMVIDGIDDYITQIMIQCE